MRFAGLPRPDSAGLKRRSISLSDLSRESTAVQIATTQTIQIAAGPTRREHDLLGECDVPQKAMLTVRQPRQGKPKMDS